MFLLPVAPVMCPKLVLVMSVLGWFHCGVFTTLKPSPRICSFQRSVIWKLRKTEASRFQNPGPLVKLGPRLPNCPAAGGAKQFVVTLALQIVLSNQAFSFLREEP